MIKIENLSFSYKKNSVYKNFNAQFEKNNVSVILGHNGSGKTTLLKLINGLLLPKVGRIVFTKNIIQTQDVRDIYYLPEQNGCYTNLSVKENVSFFEAIGQGNKESAQQVINLFRLTHKLNSKVNTLSQGLTKRVALANCAMYNSNLLLLDEPTNGIDPETKDILINYINSTKKDKTIILSTHDLSFTAEVADQIFIIDNGNLVLNEELNDKNIETLKEKYLQYTVEGMR